MGRREAFLQDDFKVKAARITGVRAHPQRAARRGLA
jgi:ribosomal protein S18